jgi:glycosyltransferase involved in cell wall biosynthesis
MRWRLRNLGLMLRGRLCRKILAISEEVKQRMVEWYHYPKKKIAVVYYGVDLCKYRPDAAVRRAVRKEFGIGETDVVVVSTARLCEQKRIDRLIDAFEAFCGDKENVRLVVVGDGPLRKQLEEQARQKSCDGRIRFVGHQEDVSGFLKMSDIYVLPSDMEGLGIAMLEAMAAGLIVVVTKTPGPNEIIDDGVNGFLVECSTEGVLDGLSRALSVSDKQRAHISANAESAAKRNFEIEARTRKALELLGLKTAAVC